MIGSKDSVQTFLKEVCYSLAFLNSIFFFFNFFRRSIVFLVKSGRDIESYHQPLHVEEESDKSEWNIIVTTTVGKAIPQRSIINIVSNTTFVILCYGHYVVEFGTMLNMDLWTLTIHAVVVTVMFHVLAVQHWFLIFLIAFFNSFLVRQPTVLLSFLMKRYKMDINRVDPSTLEHLNTFKHTNFLDKEIIKFTNYFDQILHILDHLYLLV